MMSGTTVFLIVLSIVFSVVLAYFQYFKIKNNQTKPWLLFLLRTISILGILLLLLDLKFKKDKISTIKPNLTLLLDNSGSIKNINTNNSINEIVESIKEDNQLNERFKINSYSFGENLVLNDSLNFNQTSTNIYKTIKSAVEINENAKYPILLLTDGNQTQGINYTGLKTDQDIYPIILGDTTTYQDLKISQTNVNKYAYLGNKFPVECFVVYEGNKKNVNAKVSVKKDSYNLLTKNISLGVQNNAQQVSFYLNANEVGLHNYKLSVTTLKDEKNKFNNQSNFSVEVINEKAKVLLISSIKHPDIGMLKRAISHNKQRVLEIKKPTDQINLYDYQMVILYQPNESFDAILAKINDQKKNVLYITGTKTNWQYINTKQSYFNKKVISKDQDYGAKFNSGFSVFLTDDIAFEQMPPLQDKFGDISFSVPYETLLFQKIGDFETQKPLLVTFEDNEIRNAALFGENSWRWRMNKFVENKSFNDYDEFINKTLQYLSSTKRADLLEFQVKPYYYSNDKVKITANYYDANFQFNDKVKLWIEINNKGKKSKFPFALKDNFFEVNLSNLESGNYTFKIYDENKQHTKKGFFTILPYNIEQQNIGANKKDLQLLADQNNGIVSYPESIDELKNKLLNNKNYKSIQKSELKTTPLIDWRWLLGLIVLSLALEWFVRKYKGFI